MKSPTKSPRRFKQKLQMVVGFYEKVPGGSDGKESTCNAEDLGWIPGLGRSPLRRKWQPTEIFLPRIPMDRGAWWATVHAVPKSGT